MFVTFKPMSLAVKTLGANRKLRRGVLHLALHVHALLAQGLVLILGRRGLGVD